MSALQRSAMCIAEMTEQLLIDMCRCFIEVVMKFAEV